jgi:azurin
MKLSSTICLLFACVCLCVPVTASGQAKAAASAAKGARTIHLTASDAMKYDLTTIRAKPGETLHIVLKNVGSMPRIAMAHNVVVLKPGTDATAFTNAGITSRETDYIGPSVRGQVLTATPLAGAGETVELTFKVPAKRATYPFVCTFPGHFASGMHGTIVAK